HRGNVRGSSGHARVPLAAQRARGRARPRGDARLLGAVLPRGLAGAGRAAPARALAQGEGRAVRRFLPVLVALLAVAAVVTPYLALGGASYEPTPVADPCKARDWRNPGSLSQVAEQIVLSGLDGAACKLGVSREDLMLAVR